MLLPPNNYAFTSAPHFPLFPIIIVTKCALKLTICNSSFAVANMLLISNKISINKNKQIYFYIFFLCFSLLIFFTSPRQWGLRGIFHQRKQLFCHISLCFQIFLLLLLPESDKQRATVSAPAVTASVALPADIKKPPIETGAGTFYGGNL